MNESYKQINEVVDLYPNIILLDIVEVYYLYWALHNQSCWCTVLALYVFFSFSDGSLYSALSAMGKQLGSIRRTYSSNKLLKTEDKWMLSEWAEMLQTVLKCAKESKQLNVSYNFVTAQSEDHILAFIIGPSAVHEPITFTFAAYLYSIYNIYVDKPCYTNCWK